jgi:hypothetical protein
MNAKIYCKKTFCTLSQKVCFFQRFFFVHDDPDSKQAMKKLFFFKKKFNKKQQNRLDPPGKFANCVVVCCHRACDDTLAGVGTQRAVAPV